VGQSPNSPSLWLALRVRCECTAAKSVSNPNNLPAVLAPSGVELELASLRQSLALIRLKLRSSAHSQRLGEMASGSDSGANSGRSGLCTATILIAARAGITWARRPKHLRKRRAAWFWGSDRNFAAQHPQGATKARRIRALTSKTPESDSISTAVWPGRAAQGQADQGKRLSERSAT
jgi:hypothetical protein